MTELRDLIILVPGILGSVLQRADKKIWDVSVSVLLDVMARGKGIQSLELQDPDKDDGVRAVGLIQGATLIPGFFKVDGYAALSELIRKDFRYAAPAPTSDPAGFHEFPYDWRRDNRQIANALATFVEDRLAAWRQFRNNTSARVIFISHSMGGLICNYYLDHLGGWKHCRALITMGTPFRGSMRAANFLVNGYTKAGIKLSNALRSFPSMYQLLPDYAVFRGQPRDCTLAEAGFVAALDRAAKGSPPSCGFKKLMEAGVGLSRELQMAAAQNGWPLGGDIAPPYSIVCFVGTRQATLQSARLRGSQWIVSEDIPEVAHGYPDGDGTVPHYSAMHEAVRRDPARLHSFAAFHAGLPSNPELLVDLTTMLRQFQVAKDPEVGFVPSGGSELRLEGLQDRYDPGEPIHVVAQILGEPNNVPLEVQVLEEGEKLPEHFPMTPVGDRQEYTLRDVSIGIHHLTVRPFDRAEAFPRPVTDIFAVLPPEPPPATPRTTGD